MSQSKKPHSLRRKAGQKVGFAVNQSVRHLTIVALTFCLFACGGGRFKPATAQRVPVQNATPDVTHQALLYGLSQVRTMQVRTNTPALIIARWGSDRQNFIVRYDITSGSFTTQLVQSTGLRQQVRPDGRIYIHRRYHTVVNQISRYADSFLQARGARLGEPQETAPQGMAPRQNGAQITSVGGNITGGSTGSVGVSTGDTTGGGGSQECLNGEADPVEAERALSSMNGQLSQCLSSAGVQLAVTLVVETNGNIINVVVSGDISDDERVCLEATMMQISLSPPSGGCAEHHTVISL